MFESLPSKLRAIKENNKDEWVNIPIAPAPSESILFPQDQIKINNAVIKYPLGSYQMGEIARLSGLLHYEGVNVLTLLKRECIRRNIDTTE